MARHPALALLLLLPAVSARAQVDDHFPLAVGNAWTFFTPLDSVPPDTVWDHTSGVSAAVTVNDTLYFVVDYPFSPADTLRADEEGHVFARLGGRDVLLFDFTVAGGATYPFASPRAPGITFTVTVDRLDTCEAAAGRFSDCVRLDFDDPEWLDEDLTFVFAPRVGIVWAYGDGGWYEELFAAQVAGRIISSRELAAPSATQAFAYPNPFGTSATIVVPATGAATMRMRVYDVLGGLAATPDAGTCDGLTCRFRLDGAQLPAGPYFVLAEQGGHVHTMRLILRR
jgi:hypothetical protein